MGAAASWVPANRQGGSNCNRLGPGVWCCWLRLAAGRPREFTSGLVNWTFGHEAWAGSVSKDCDYSTFSAPLQPCRLLRDGRARRRWATFQALVLEIGRHSSITTRVAHLGVVAPRCGRGTSSCGSRPCRSPGASPGARRATVTVLSILSLTTRAGELALVLRRRLRGLAHFGARFRLLGEEGVHARDLAAHALDLAVLR